MAVVSVEGDLREQNRMNAVLFIGNFLGGLYGILAATSVIIELICGSYKVPYRSPEALMQT